MVYSDKDVTIGYYWLIYIYIIYIWNSDWRRLSLEFWFLEFCVGMFWRRRKCSYVLTVQKILRWGYFIHGSGFCSRHSFESWIHLKLKSILSLFFLLCIFLDISVVILHYIIIALLHSLSPSHRVLLYEQYLWIWPIFFLCFFCYFSSLHMVL